jgi:superfamily II RNA helicase
MIQEKLFNILGSVTELNGKSIDPIELCMELLSKREYIKEYCSTLSNSITRKRKNQSTGHNPYQYSVGVSVTYTDGKGKKGKGKPQKNKTAGRASNHELLTELGFSSEFVDENYKLGLKPRAQFTSADFGEPYVTKKRNAREFKSGAGGTKAGYKQDTFDEPDWKEVHLTPPKKCETEKHELISVNSLPEWMRPAFHLTEKLNTIQSIVFDSAFNTTSNVLVAAPTGAGKTNIALLTILREVKKYVIVKEGRFFKFG